MGVHTSGAGPSKPKGATKAKGTTKPKGGTAKPKGGTTKPKGGTTKPKGGSKSKKGCAKYAAYVQWLWQFETHAYTVLGGPSAGGRLLAAPPRHRHARR